MVSKLLPKQHGCRKKSILMAVAIGVIVPAVSFASGREESKVTPSTGESFVFIKQQKVSGVVTGPDGPIVGATVSVVGTSRSTMTDAEGRFSIEASNGATLRVSFIGLTPKNVIVNDVTMNIALGTEDNALDEVVVVGYGTQRRGNVTGAVSTVNVKENLQGRTVVDVGRAIQGTTPGLTITVPSGEVGSDPVIKIRGAISSITGSSAPLILLDNVEIPSIQYVNPDDIESITVLKDAAASSIYGAKASTGVVLITTKTGAAGKASISYSNNFSFQNLYKKFEMGQLNALKYSIDALERVGGTVYGAFYSLDKQSYEKAVEWDKKYGGTLGPNDPTVYGRDWYVDPAFPTRKYGLRTYDPYDYMIREWAPTKTHNFSLNGTSGNTKYSATFGAVDQDGMIKPGNKDNFTRYNAGVRLSTDLTDYLTVRAGMMYSRRSKSYPYATNSSTADPWLYMYRWSSLYPMGYDELGNPIRSPWSENEFANEASMKRNYLNANVGTTIKLKSNWKVDVDYTFANEDYGWKRNGTKFTGANSWVAARQRKDSNGNPVYVNSDGVVVGASDPGAILAYDLINETYTANGSNPDHIYQRSESEYKHTLNAFTTYNLVVNNDHDFKFILGSNLVTSRGTYHWNQRTNLLDITNPQFDLATGEITGSGGEYWEAQLGYFGRINYAYKNKYLFEGNLRYDGTSKFPKELKWRWYPSMSAGWVVTEESFMEPVRESLSFLKFRGSWGSIGNQGVPSDLYVPNMEPVESSWIANGTKVVGIPSPALRYPEVFWENIETLDFGADARFFNNKLGFVFDWYKKSTKNMFGQLSGVTYTIGGAPPLLNTGSLVTKGYEIAVDFNHRFENGLGINLRANFDDAKSRVYNYTSSRLTTSNYDGKVWGEIWGYETDRLYQMDDFVLDANGKTQLVNLTTAMTKYNTSGGGKMYLLKDGPNGEKPIYQSRLENSSTFDFGPGDVKFKDLNGDGEIDSGDGTVDNPGDRKVIGNSTPRFNYGFRIGADYKGFDFAVFFQGVGSRQVWGNGFLAQPGWHVSDGAMPAVFVDDYWTPDNTGAFYPAAYSNAGTADVNNMQVQSKYLLDMSYLRIKNMSLGYTFPKEWMQRAKVTNLRIYTSLENFFTWDKLRGLPIDPEEVSGFSIFNETNYNSGRTGVGTPTFKSASFGLQLTF